MFLEVEGLSFSIDKKTLLDDISFSVEEGTTTLIAGMNGSGKSMLLKCLKGLEQPQAGAIRLAGREMPKRKDRMKAFALVFQDTALEIVGSTVERDIAFGPENLGWPRKAIEEKTGQLLEFFSLQGHRNVRPAVLSGGEARKLAIAGVLAMEPEVLLLDEPFANLDYPSTVKVIHALDQLHEKGVTILIVSHEAEKFLRHTDSTLILERGRIAASGRSRDMLGKLSEHSIYVPKGAVFEQMSWLC